ncbi:xanthine dehydrogenase family protein molybdopterin-binding subunit [Streptomyces melanosporofaciens]|uniref:Xanthine dehydrogenase YagR molybdenum-binding subunit n=1 Tax=Streptomyces melanosporofaciens TaxID=67327 RepID=A0A1H5CC65_STRMJ|nr:xanthine dehydrogenase family protein molybdopterin-binding subunit [Streptomyces melanosporofaciens]SED63920.1 xanthine dehydrogenase YagR molybdenum-binding subunit [Streptomyces melanosporofaciens]
MTPSAVGAPVSRVDGHAKVTGAATYAAEFEPPRLVHAVMVSSTIGLGRVTGIDTRAARAQQGVLEVLSHLNAPKLPYRDFRTSIDPPVGERLHVLQDNRVRFFGQPIAVVIAETLETARHAAGLVEVTYAAEQPSTELATSRQRALVPAGEQGNYSRGDVDAALRTAHTVIDRKYRMVRESHNPMEPHATVARWDGDTLTLWDKAQWVQSTAPQIAAVFGLPKSSVRVISPYVGGAFGSALRAWPHVTLAAMAARQVGRPVKLVLTRKQMFSGTGYRAAVDQRIVLASDRNGRLTGLAHEARAETSRYEQHQDAVLELARVLYSVPSVRASYRLIPLDVHTPTFARGPGRTPAAFAIESALDELAYELRMDPIELRLRNEPARDESTGRPFSTRRLRECFRVGAQKFGWEQRNPRVRSTRDGHWLIGTGVATACYHTLRGAARALARIDADGSATVSSATSDMGPGTYTSMSQVASDGLGVAMSKVRFRLGDSRLPLAPSHGGSQTMASVGSAVQDACDKLREAAIALAVADPQSSLHGADPKQVRVRGGRLFLPGAPHRGETYERLLRRQGRTHLEATGTYTPGEEVDRYSSYAYGAVFAEVAVDESLGLVRARRLFSAFDAGRIISPKLAHSQAIGGMVGGIGMALLEHTVTDHRDGRLVNASMADYLVPVNADVPEVDALYLNGEDKTADPIGVKGLGEVTIVGVAPAIANAVHHATGRRVQDLPITLESVL